MIKWKMSKSRRKWKEEMKLKKIIVWLEEMRGEVGIDRRGVIISR